MFVFVSKGAAASEPAAVVGPDTRGKAGLRADLERIVAAEESNGWFLDRTSIEAIYPVLLQSVCRTSLEGRAEALRELADESCKSGSAKSLFEQAGRLTTEVEQALHNERLYQTLKTVIDGAAQDCPFYVTAKPGYDGRQTDRNRFTLSLETGGLVQLRQTAGTWGYGGGGTLRILPGYGFGAFSVHGGLELAGGAMLRPGDASRFVVNYFPALPVVLRLRSKNGTGMWHTDLEVAAVSLLQADDTHVSFGGRIGGGLGISALRTRFFIPWAGIAAAYEFYPDAARPAAHFLRAGVRLGFQWDPFAI
jgi:hypothetical protein